MHFFVFNSELFLQCSNYWKKLIVIKHILVVLQLPIPVNEKSLCECKDIFGLLGTLSFWYLIGRRLLKGFSSRCTSTFKSIPLSICIRLKSRRASPILYEVKSNGAPLCKYKSCGILSRMAESLNIFWPVGLALQKNLSRYPSRDFHGAQKIRS